MSKTIEQYAKADQADLDRKRLMLAEMLRQYDQAPAQAPAVKAPSTGGLLDALKGLPGIPGIGGGGNLSPAGMMPLNNPYMPGYLGGTSAGE
jgi:hypothetical protein